MPEQGRPGPGLPEPGLSGGGAGGGVPTEPDRPGEWLTVDGVAYRCVVLCFLFRPGDAHRGAHTGNRHDGAPAYGGPHDGRAARDVLLGLKRTGFGAGRVVALGGKIDGRESALEAVVREVAEESGIALDPSAVHEAGRITWSFPARPAWNMAAFLFTADTGPATPVPSEEIEPRWYAEDAIPWHSMWQDGPHWIPLLLDGRWVDAAIVMDRDNEGVASAVVR